MSGDAALRPACSDVHTTAAKEFFSGKADLAISLGHFGARFMISLAGIKVDDESEGAITARAAIQVMPEVTRRPEVRSQWLLRKDFHRESR